MACLQLWQKIFINNEFINAVSGKFFPTINPASGIQIVPVAEGDKADVDLAVGAAKAAFERKSAWRELDASKRAALMLKLADLMEQNIHLMSSVETLDNGKPYVNAVNEVKYSAEALRYFAGWCDKIHGKTIPADGSVMALTRKEPVGVVGQIIPWNYPLLMLTWKMAPALAAGCTLVIKPSELTPLTALMMGALSKEAGFPPGVLNIVPGCASTVGTAIVNHCDIDKVTSTGSQTVCHTTLEPALKANLRGAAAELGGKSPLVVFDDFDLEEAVNIAHNGAFCNQGQYCSAASRTFVHEKIYDEFVKKATEKAQKRIVGDPFAPNTQQGPQIDGNHLNKILKQVECAVEEGAKLETGGKQKGKEGFFMEPAVFSNVTDNMKIAREEIYGPVQTVLKFCNLDDVIERSNSLPCGLAAGVLTNDINKALSYAQAVKAGTIWVNCYNHISPQLPHGGYKSSITSTDLGYKAVKAYTESKTITIKTCNKN